MRETRGHFRKIKDTKGTFLAKMGTKKDRNCNDLTETEVIKRIARRDKKAILNEQCKETGENNRMGKTRYRFKKILNIKKKSDARMGTIKDRNSKDLTETE